MKILRFLLPLMFQAITIPSVYGQTPVVLDDEFTLWVDYNKSWDQMVEAGQYGFRTDFISPENFPIPTKLVGRMERLHPQLFYFSSAVSGSEVIKFMSQKGYRPATLFELLALGAKDPNLQTKYKINALGSVLRSKTRQPHYYVPCLGFFEGSRSLSIGFLDVPFPAGERFLGIRE
jgi:hypothetical protein